MEIKDKNIALRDTTCFKEHKEHRVRCEKTDCKYWIDSDKNMNCIMIMASDGPSTLQEIGEIFGVTRMRICQIEKTVMNKLRNKTKIDVDY